MSLQSIQIVFCICLYLSGQRHFNRHGYQLCQEAAVEGHHEHHRVIVGENKCNLKEYHRHDMSWYDMLRRSCFGHGVQQVSRSETKHLLPRISNEAAILYLSKTE